MLSKITQLEIVLRNVCPGTIYVTARGAWKLAGLEHAGKNKEMEIFFTNIDLFFREDG